MTQCENCRISKIDMHIPYRNSIARYVIVEDDATRRLYSIKNQYLKYHVQILVFIIIQNTVNGLSKKLGHFILSYATAY